MSYFFQEWVYPINLLEEFNLTFPPHLHDTVELIHIAEGSVNLTINKKNYTLRTGDFAAVFPGQLHGFVGNGCPNKIHLAIFHLSQIPHFVQDLEHRHPANPVLSREEIDPDLLLAFHRLFALDSNTDPRIRQAWIQLIMAHLLSIFELEENSETGEAVLIARILEYLSAHYAQPLTLELLAKELHVNKYYLSHTFSNKLYISFSTCLNRFRIERAMELLKTTDLSIEVIGEQVGFETQRTFNRVFKNMVWHTPSEYRKNHFTDINRTPMPHIKERDE